MMPLPLGEALCEFAASALLPLLILASKGKEDTCRITLLLAPAEARRRARKDAWPKASLVGAPSKLACSWVQIFCKSTRCMAMRCAAVGAKAVQRMWRGVGAIDANWGRTHPARRTPARPESLVVPPAHRTRIMCNGTMITRQPWG